LVGPDLDRKMKIEVDTSDYIMGEVLSMKYRDGKWRLVAYLSRSFNETKRNYGIHNKEILLIIRKLENWRHLLKGTKFKFEIWIDHNWNIS